MQVGRDSSVGIVTRYGLDGPAIESRWWRDFPHPSRPAPGAYPASSTMGTGSFPGVKRPGDGADHPPHLQCRGQERVGLYLYSPSGPSWSVMGAPLPLPSQYKSFTSVKSELSTIPCLVFRTPVWLRTTVVKFSTAFSNWILPYLLFV